MGLGKTDAALRHCRQSNHGRGTDMSHTGGPDPDGRGRWGVISRRGASRSVRCTGPGTKRSRAAAGFLMGLVGFAALLALPLQAPGADDRLVGHADAEDHILRGPRTVGL